MKQDRFLLAILGGIGVMIVAALIVFFSRQSDLNFGTETTAQGVVRNYILALEKGDYERAYAYLQAQDRPTYDQFVQYFTGSDPTMRKTAVRIGETRPVGERTLVDLTLIHQSSEPFQGAYYEAATASLKQEGDRWYIVQMPYPYWSWDWGEKPPP